MGKVFNILIIDDEADSRELLGNLILKHFEYPHQIVFSKTFSEAVLNIQKLTFDVVFSDCKLPNYHDNKIFELISHKKTQIVISTALGIEAFKSNDKRPIYFLQKPVDIDDFKTICQMVSKNILAYENSLMI